MMGDVMTSARCDAAEMCEQQTIYACKNGRVSKLEGDQGKMHCRYCGADITAMVSSLESSIKFAKQIRNIIAKGNP